MCQLSTCITCNNPFMYFRQLYCSMMIRWWNNNKANSVKLTLSGTFLLARLSIYPSGNSFSGPYILFFFNPIILLECFPALVGDHSTRWIDHSPCLKRRSKLRIVNWQLTLFENTVKHWKTSKTVKLWNCETVKMWNRMKGNTWKINLKTLISYLLYCVLLKSNLASA